MLARFRARLGVPVHALHSGLNDNERARVWTAAWRGEARVHRRHALGGVHAAAGCRADRRRRGTRRQLQAAGRHPLPRARFRAGARQGARRAGVLGSATPSLESLHNARSRPLRAPAPAAARRRRATAGGARARRAQAAAAGWAVAGTAATRSRAALDARRTGAGVQEPPRLRTGAAVPRLRLERAMPALRRAR